MARVGDLFKPINEHVKCKSQMERFRRFINARFSVSLKDPWDLHAWSVRNRALFWDSVWDFYCIIGEKGQQPVSSIQNFHQNIEADTLWKLHNAPAV